MHGSSQLEGDLWQLYNEHYSDSSEREMYERTSVVIRYVFVTTFVRLSLADLVYAAVMDSISFPLARKTGVAIAT